MVLTTALFGQSIFGIKSAAVLWGAGLEPALGGA
jgi:hypothetical protein